MPRTFFSPARASMRRSHLMSAPMSNDRMKSMTPRKPAMMNTATITTSVEPMTSRRLGHVTFLVSAWTSCRKVVTRATYSRIAHYSHMRVCRPKSHGHVKKAGQEGFEPPTPGFGVRCSSRSSYWPLIWLSDSTSRGSFHKGGALPALPCLTVNRMLAAKATIFFTLQSIWGGAFVLHGGVITLSTAVAC